MGEGGLHGRSRLLDRNQAGAKPSLMLCGDSIGAYGGAEKSMIQLANHLVNRAYRVTLVTTGSDRRHPSRPLDLKIDHVALDVNRKSANVLASVGNVGLRYLALRRAFRRIKPDLIISFGIWRNVLTVAAAKRHVPVIVSERDLPGQAHEPPIWNSLRPYAYRRARRLVCVSQDAVDYFEPAIRSKAVIITPSIDPSLGDRARAQTPRRLKRIVGLGRLVPDKGFASLIEAFGLVAGSHPDWELWIWGAGRETDALRDQIERLGLDRQVLLAGITADPLAELARGSIFAHAPWFDGVGNVYLEAMSCQLPVVTTAAPGGVRTVVTPETGFLVEPGDVNAFAARLDELMSDSHLRETLGSAGRRRVERFTLDRVHESWLDLIEDTLNIRGGSTRPDFEGAIP